MMPEKFDNELLITLVKNRPLLWDKSLDSHKDLNQRSGAWREICKVMCPGYEALPRKEKHLYAKSVIKKWTNIRDAWRKSMLETKTKNKTKPYIYHDYLRFLEKNLYHLKDSFLDEEDSRSKTSGVEPEEGEILERTDPYITADSDDASLMHYSGMVHLEDDSLRARKRRIGEGEINGTESNIQVMEVKSLNSQTEENPHVCFIRGLLPTLNKLNEDEVLDFQAGVIQLLQCIRKKGTFFNDIIPNYGLAPSSIDLNQDKGDIDDN